MGKSEFSNDMWDTIIGPRYRDQRSITGKEMARTLGIHEATLTSQMRRRGFYRNVAAGAVPQAFADLPERATLADLLGFDFDPRDLRRSAAELMDKAGHAAREGRLGHFRELMGSLLLMLRVRRETETQDVGALFAGPDEGGGLIEGQVREAEAPAQTLVLRSAQTPPDGNWKTWLFLGGRGAGKTLAGASWLADQAEAVGPDGRLALVGATLHDVREVMIDGPSGLMSLPRWGTGKEGRPVYEPSRRRLRFPNGAKAAVYSAEDPDSLRGPQFEAAWADEFCAWARPEETLAMLRLGLRRGADPRLVVTTTPKPVRALKTLKAEAGCVTSHSATRENLMHLAPGFLDGLTALYGGTRREAQELNGQIVEMEGGLFRAEDLARARHLAGARPERFDRIVVALDPTATVGGDACGIVAVGRVGGVAHVLADRSMRGLTPDGWARRAVALMEEVGAREIVAEVNQGGEMVVQTLKTARPDVTVRQVRATTGKRLRAEPVAALYEQGRVLHHGWFGELEEELMALGGADESRLSLDRADALVWAVTDLLLTRRGEGPRFTQL